MTTHAPADVFEAMHDLLHAYRAHSGADKAQVARMVGMLQDKGWLESAPNAEDKRSRCLRLSAQGATLHQALRDARPGLAAALLKGRDDATQAQLLPLLAQVRSTLDAVDTGCQGGRDCRS